MDNPNILEISFLKESTLISNDSSSDQLQHLNFSNVPSSTQSSSNSVQPSTKKRKRDTNNNTNTSINTSPTPKRQRTSESTSQSSTLSNNTIQSTSKADKHNKKSKNNAAPKSHQPLLRRSTRIKNKHNNINISKSDDDLNCLSVPLSALKLSNKPKKNCSVQIVENKNKTHNTLNINNKQENNNNNNNINDVSEWNDLLCNRIQSKWNAKATPIKSSLKTHKTQKRISRKVNWGNVNCRNFEQRCGVLSCGVPNESGPSLHLGKLISEQTVNINEYGNKKEVKELAKKERIERVKQFCSSDLDKCKLKQDRDEIKLLQKSRIEIGCKCKSIYKMTKNEIIERILYFDNTKDKKILNKLKKCDVFNTLIKFQFEKYGRYDVCCIDELCECYKQGIECQIDSECCMCGGNIIYNNYLHNNNNNNNNNNKNIKIKVNKKNSLCCGNPNGNTLNVCVLDYINNEKNKNIDEHDIVKTVKSTFLEFTSPFVQKRISEWKKHYDNDDECQDKENNTKLKMVLNFDS